MKRWKYTFKETENQYRNITYKDASKLPKGGAVAMDFTNLQATAADVIGHRFAMRPEAIFNWGKKYNLNLQALVGRIDLNDMMNYVLNDIEPDKKYIELMKRWKSTR
jgi:hypothetical protein